MEGGEGAPNGGMRAAAGPAGAAECGVPLNTSLDAEQLVARPSWGVEFVVEAAAEVGATGSVAGVERQEVRHSTELERMAEVAELDAETAERQAEIAELDAETAELNAETAELDAETVELEAETVELEVEIVARGCVALHADELHEGLAFSALSPWVDEWRGFDARSGGGGVLRKRVLLRRAIAPTLAAPHLRSMSLRLTSEGHLSVLPPGCARGDATAGAAAAGESAAGGRADRAVTAMLRRLVYGASAARRCALLRDLDDEIAALRCAVGVGSTLRRSQDALLAVPQHPPFLCLLPGGEGRAVPRLVLALALLWDALCTRAS